MEEILPKTNPIIWIVKEITIYIRSWFIWLLEKVWCFRELFLYFYDIFSDVLLTIKLYRKCHWNYVTTSMTIFAYTMFFTTVNMVVDLIQEDGEKSATKILIHIFYPCLLISETLKKSRNQKMPEKTQLKAYRINFMESVLESYPQFGLSMYIVLHHGLDEDYVIFKGDLQLLSIFGSFFNVLKNFSTHQAFWKYKQQPTLKQMAVGGLFSIIPTLSAFTSIILILSKPKHIGYLFVIILAIAKFFYLVARIKRSLAFFRKKEYLNGTSDQISKEDIMKKYFQTMTNFSQGHFQKTHIKFCTANRMLMLITFAAAFFHTLQFATNDHFNKVMFDLFKSGNETFESYQGYYEGENSFNACQKSAENGSNLEMLQKNFVDQNPVFFLYLTWILFCLGIVQLILEWKYELVPEVNWWQFIHGPNIEQIKV